MSLNYSYSHSTSNREGCSFLSLLLYALLLCPCFGAIYSNTSWWLLGFFFLDATNILQKNCFFFTPKYSIVIHLQKLVVLLFLVLFPLVFWSFSESVLQGQTSLSFLLCCILISWWIFWWTYLHRPSSCVISLYQLSVVQLSFFVLLQKIWCKSGL